MNKRALITSITGQGGSYLADLLLSKDYEVHGIVRHVALKDPANRLSRASHFLAKGTLHPGSVDSCLSIYKIFGEVQIGRVVSLAACSFVGYSFGSVATGSGKASKVGDWQHHDRQVLKWRHSKLEVA
jgi:GDPmannose 4,6-dehydratase